MRKLFEEVPAFFSFSSSVSPKKKNHKSKGNPSEKIVPLHVKICKL
jgi:hypothetical protein